MKKISLILVICLIFFFFISILFNDISFSDNIISLKPLWIRGGSNDNISFKLPTGFCIDQNSQYVYVADTGNDRILIFNSDGRFVRNFYTSRKIKKPFDVICGPDGHVYISQMDKAKIDVFDEYGIYLFSAPKGDEYEKLRPGRMAFDTDGMLIFGDRAGGEIILVDKEGVVRKTFEHKDDKSLLTGICAGGGGMIYTTWAQGAPVRIFKKSGEIFLTFGNHRQIDSGFSFPSSLTIDKDEHIWIVDAIRHKVKVFEQQGDYLFQAEVNDLVFPIDLEFDKKGRIYILEKGEGRIRAFEVGLVR